MQIQFPFLPLNFESCSTIFDAITMCVCVCVCVKTSPVLIKTATNVRNDAKNYCVYVHCVFSKEIDDRICESVLYSKYCIHTDKNYLAQKKNQINTELNAFSVK